MRTSSDRPRSHLFVAHQARIQRPGLRSDVASTERVNVLKRLQGGSRPRWLSCHAVRSRQSACGTETVRLLVVNLDVELPACGAKFRNEHIAIEPVSAGSVEAHGALADISLDNQD